MKATFFKLDSGLYINVNLVEWEEKAPPTGQAKFDKWWACFKIPTCLLEEVGWTAQIEKPGSA